MWARPRTILDMGALPSPASRDDPSLRVPPHSLEAEQSVLGGLLLDNGAWERVVDLIAA